MKIIDGDKLCELIRNIYGEKCPIYLDDLKSKISVMEPVTLSDVYEQGFKNGIKFERDNKTGVYK